jgi:molybdopterin synthase catalytic subunit
MMQLHVELTQARIVPAGPLTTGGTLGAWVEFTGIVRGEEGGRPIAALEYEAYDSMAKRVITELLEQLGAHHGCEAAHVIHRVGVIPVGEAAIWIGVGSGHRQEALALVTGFMDQLKQEVPIWKRRALTAVELSTLPQ